MWYLLGSMNSEQEAASDRLFYVYFIIVFVSPQKANYGLKLILDSKRKKENVGSLKNSFEMPSLAKVVCVASLPP